MAPQKGWVVFAVATLTAAAAVAAAVAAALAKRAARPVEVAERVHPARLLSFVKERLEKGEAIPFDLFGIHPFSRAKLKAPSAKKSKG